MSQFFLLAAMVVCLSDSAYPETNVNASEPLNVIRHGTLEQENRPHINVSEIFTRLETLEQENVNLEQKMAEQDEVIEELQLGLKQKMAEQDDVLEDLQLGLKQKMAEQNDVIRDLQLGLQQKMAEQDDVLADLQLHLARMMEAVDELNPQKFQEFRAVQVVNETIGFSAFSRNGMFDYVAGQRLEFDGEAWNSGSYDPAVSIFQCPRSGLYMVNIDLYFVLAADNDFSAAVNVIQESDIIATVAGGSSATSGDYSEHASSTVLTSCTPGQLIYSEAMLPSRVESCSTCEPTGRSATFTVFLLATI